MFLVRWSFIVTIPIYTSYLHMKSVFDPHPCQLLALSVFYHFNQLPSTWVAMSHHGFNSHFSPRTAPLLVLMQESERHTEPLQSCGLCPWHLETGSALQTNNRLELQWADSYHGILAEIAVLGHSGASLTLWGGNELAKTGTELILCRLYVNRI